MQALQHQSRPVGKEPDQLVIADLICDAGTNTAGRGKCLVGKGRAVLGNPEEWSSQTARGHELVDCIGIEQLGKAIWSELVSWGQQRLLPPVLTRELITVDSYKSIENSVLSGSRRRWLSGQVLAHCADWSCPNLLPAGTAICTAVGPAVRATISSAVGATISSAVGSTIAYARDALGAAIGGTLTPWATRDALAGTLC